MRHAQEDLNDGFQLRGRSGHFGVRRRCITDQHVDRKRGGLPLEGPIRRAENKVILAFLYIKIELECMRT